MKKTLKIVLSALMVFCMGIALAGCSSAQDKETKDTSTENKTEDTGFKQTESQPGGKKYQAVVKVKDYGDIVFEMDEGIAPLTVENFVNLANSGFYDGLTFHRIMDGFMIQGGDPNGNGTGGSDQKIKGEFASNGYSNSLSHVRGTVSMARSAVPDSASSQFFIVQDDSTFLDGDYAAFGTVTEGMDVVDAIAKAAKPTDNNGSIAPDEQPVIESVTVTEISE